MPARASPVVEGRERLRLRRSTRILLGPIAFVGSWMLSGWARVNGPNYDSWATAFLAFGLVALTATTLAVVAPRRPSRTRVAIAAFAVGIAVACAAISIHCYGDGRAPSNIPAYLAWASFGALTLGVAAISIPFAASRNRRARLAHPRQR